MILDRVTGKAGKRRLQSRHDHTDPSQRQHTPAAQAK
jgi:hypothetical protein